MKGVAELNVDGRKGGCIKFDANFIETVESGGRAADILSP